MNETVALLAPFWENRLSPAARQWLDGALGDHGFDRDAFMKNFGAAARKVGKAPVDLDDAEMEAARAARIDWLIGGASVVEMARVALLVKEAARAPGEDEGVSLVLECYRQGENSEKRAVLRALSLLPAPARFLDVGVNACRTHVQTVFEAIACENPYPAACFPPLNFNQMVLKALFTGAALGRIIGLHTRITPELVRMAAGYASERRAAGRSVPSDIELILRHNGDKP